MPIPRIHKPRILTIRSNDLIPMDGVLPTNADLKKFNIKVVKIPNAKHMDYCDRGNIEIKKITNQIIIEFIK
jgi:pimeloyl-ACP methyl ester carboxylesterase